ncbi:hypothetical protein P3W85_11320 [Cupriavidus basilensis]|uniref:Uncharacterized protein n=1 Tax=Cupriavidus basilensis TaxID=68895 RepID=A0ABT6AMA3_9BURK|nr:hypothetical protein [Cupriavidus basilensis]MDF3833533.1 hypothetical protein [Cupriavidus basilensis]
MILGRGLVETVFTPGALAAGEVTVAGLAEHDVASRTKLAKGLLQQPSKIELGEHRQKLTAFAQEHAGAAELTLFELARKAGMLASDVVSNEVRRPESADGLGSRKAGQFPWLLDSGRQIQCDRFTFAIRLARLTFVGSASARTNDPSLRRLTGDALACTKVNRLNWGGVLPRSSLWRN